MKRSRRDRLHAERLDQTLEQLEGHDWGDPGDSTALVARLHRLRKVPLRDLRVADLETAIGQKMGLLFLLPVALEALEEDPFVSGDFYPGDLLVAVARSVGDAVVWDAERRARFRQLLERALPRRADAEAPAFLNGELRAALDRL